MKTRIIFGRCSMKCKWFACVYAMKGGCTIQGYMSEEGGLNGEKKNCTIYDVECINAKCKCCAREGSSICE